MKRLIYYIITITKLAIVVKTKILKITTITKSNTFNQFNKQNKRYNIPNLVQAFSEEYDWLHLVL